MDRRRFIGAAGIGLTILSGALGRSVLSAANQPRLAILHTNDTHSRIDPFPPEDGRFSGLGGVTRRKALIDRIRREETYSLLLDSGDIFQGTPYFNLYGGEVEIQAMNHVGYDVATVGNHEFDNGISGLERTMPLADFQWVSSNLDWSGATTIGPLVKPWTIQQVGPFRIGIFGLLCRLEGLVAPANFAGVVQRDTVESARAVVADLKRRGCNLIVCLSHLGYATREGDSQLRDDRLPAEVEGVDLILGGHSHTFLDELVALPRKRGGLTWVTQQGWAGVRLGRVDVRLGSSGSLAMSQSPIAVAV